MTNQWNKDYPMGLPVLLYPLFHVEKPRRIPIFPPAAMENFKSIDYRENLKRDCEILNWSLQHKNYDFKSILDFPYANDDIVYFIQNLADLYDREKLFDLVGLECVEKLMKSKSEEKYFFDNYVDTPSRLDYIKYLFRDICQYDFPIEKELPTKFLNKYTKDWKPEYYNDIRTQIEWCKKHPNFDYAEFLLLDISNNDFLKRLKEIDEYLANLEVENLT